MKYSDYTSRKLDTFPKRRNHIQSTNIEDNNDDDSYSNKYYLIKLKDLLINSNVNNNNGSANSLINDLYAQIGRNNKLDKRINLFYLPKSNESYILLPTLNDKDAFNSISGQGNDEDTVLPHTSITHIEIVLIFFILLLWMLSVLCCFKRYSLLLCFRKRDAPYYSKSLDKSLCEYNSIGDNLKAINEQHEYNNSVNGTTTNLNNTFSNSLLNNNLMQQQQQHQQSGIKVITHTGSNGNINKMHSDSQMMRPQYGGLYSNHPTINSGHHANDLAMSHLTYNSYSNSNFDNSKLSLNIPKSPLRKKYYMINPKHHNLLSLDETALKYYTPMSSRLDPTQSPATTSAAQNSVSDSSSAIIQNRSYEENSSLCEISLSVQQQQVCCYLKPHHHMPPSQQTTPIAHHPQHQDAVSSSSIKTTAKTSSETSSASSTRRQMNPVSTLRRHMFVNSRRKGYNTQNATIGSDLNSSESPFTPPPTPITPQTQIQSASPITRPDASPHANDSNLLNPSWIPSLVRQTLLDLHRRTVLSKSDSNIKARYNRQTKSSKLARNSKQMSLENSNHQLGAHTGSLQTTNAYSPKHATLQEEELQPMKPFTEKV